MVVMIERDTMPEITKERGKYSLEVLGLILQKSAKRLGKNSPVHLAGATAFLATFSLAPIFVLIIHLLGGIIGRKEIRQKIIQKFSEDAPADSVAQLTQFIDGFQQLWGAWYVNAGLFLFLLFGASKLFILIRSSFYQLWRLKHFHEKKLKLQVRKWVFPIALIVSAGVLLMAGVLGQGLQAFLGEAVAEISPSALRYFNSFYRYAISLLVAWIWFAVVFRYLTDVRPQWKTVLVGALFTSVLYNVGKIILQPSLSFGKVHAVFGTSASLVLLQLFIFYISLLIYYGAAFTFEWARHYNQPVYIPDDLSYYTIEEKHTKESTDLS
jgi:membrane protein